MGASSERRKRLQIALRVVLGALGALAVAWLIRETGAKEVGSGLRQAAAWLPLLVALEGGRLIAETVATRLLLGSKASRVPWWPFLRANFAAFSVNMVFPAGRVGSETLKATMLSPYVGVGRVAAIAIINQALTLLSIGIVSIPCTLAAWWLTGTSLITLAVGIHGVVVVLMALLILAAARGKGIADVLSRFRRLREGTQAFRAEILELPVIPPLPAAWFVIGRMMQVGEFAVLLVALGIGFSVDLAFFAEGVNLVGAAAGDLVPAQLGTIDGAFAYAADALGTTEATAVVMAMLVHIVQLTWVAIGAVVAAVWHVPLPEATADDELPLGGVTGEQAAHEVASSNAESSHCDSETSQSEASGKPQSAAGPLSEALPRHEDEAAPAGDAALGRKRSES